MDLPNLEYAAPEIFVAIASMVLLMIGVFRGEGSSRPVAWLSMAVLIVAAVITALITPAETKYEFANLFVSSSFTTFLKVGVLLAAAVGIMMSVGYNEREAIDRFEYPVLIVLAALGMMVMVSANDLLSLYVGLELQSLALYVVAAIRRDSLKSSEAGLKYFVLGALASGMLLYGASMVYGFSGSTNFTNLATFLAEGATPSVGLIVGLVFVIVGLAFKISAVPFHMWTPDVYEGAPTPVTAFFAAAPKLAAMGLFMSVLVGPFGGLAAQWSQVVIVVSVTSMVLGAFAAIAQTNIKRLMAYSSIGHVGYALVGLASGTKDGYSAVLVYMAIYIVMTLGTVAVILAMRRNGSMVEDISDLTGLSKNNPVMAAMMLIFMFSMAGIPPLAGFYAKLYVFLAAVDAGLYFLAVIGMLASVVGAYYYIRIVKLMYFDEPEEALDPHPGRDLGLVQFVAGMATLLFFLVPGVLVGAADKAVFSLASG
ncbi:MAG: NADH-quinone oxidoreductase subunit NuoN [Rhodospirillaceae bacterium]|nr:NADH-quinone oxidoreductase subunit NuoN [Rhodospirillaceae bacterium]